MPLVASMLSDEDMVGGIDAQAFRIADAGGEACGRRERLVRLIRVIAPDAPARLEFRARTDARRVRNAILHLACISWGSHVDVHGAVAVDGKWVHGMISG